MSNSALAELEEIMGHALPYYRRVAKSMARKCRRPDLSEDLEAEAAAALWAQLARYDPDRHDNFEQSCSKAVRGAMVDFLRKLRGKSRHGVYRQFISTDAPISAVDDHTVGDEIEAPSERRRQEARAAAAWFPADWPAVLTVTERLVIKLVYWEDMSLDETAAILGFSQSRASQCSSGAIAALRELLNLTPPKPRGIPIVRHSIAELVRIEIRKGPGDTQSITDQVMKLRAGIARHSVYAAIHALSKRGEITIENKQWGFAPLPGRS